MTGPRRVMAVAAALWAVGSVLRIATGVALGHWGDVAINVAGFVLLGYTLGVLYDLLHALDASTHLVLNRGMTSDAITDLTDAYIEAGLLPTDDESDWIRRFDAFHHLNDGRLLLAVREDDGEVALTVTTGTGCVEASVRFPTTTIGLTMFVASAAAMA